MNSKITITFNEKGEALVDHDLLFLSENLLNKLKEEIKSGISSEIADLMYDCIDYDDAVLDLDYDNRISVTEIGVNTSKMERNIKTIVEENFEYHIQELQKAKQNNTQEQSSNDETRN